MKTLKAAEPAKKEIEKYEIEEAVRTLVKAEEIKANPELMAACSSMLSKQKKHIDSISGLRKKAAELDAEEESEESDEEE